VSYWAENWSAWVGAFLVIAIYTYLWKDNPLYRITMQVFIGVNVGYQVVIQWRDILYPQWWIPMVDGFQALFLGGSGSPWGALWAVAGLLGLFWYFQMSRKLMWLSRIVMGVMIGITAGVTIKSQLGTNLPQLTDSFRPLGPSIVGPQPRRLFSLPPTTVAPSIDSNLGFFGSGGQVVCVETLGGMELWRQAVFATGPLERAANRVLVPASAGTTVLDVSNGATSAVETVGLWYEDSSLYWQNTKIADVVGAPIEYSEADGHLAIAPVRSGVDAYQIPGGRRVWHLDSPPVAGLALAQGALVIVQGNTLETIDVLSGQITGRLPLPGRPDGQPIVCSFADPAEDKQYVLLPMEGRNLTAIQIAANPGLNRQPGEVLWSTKLSFQPQFGKSIEGQLLVSGPDGGAAYELPHPSKKLGWTDYLDSWVFFLTLASVMTYFFFSFKRRSVLVEKTSMLGRYMLMIGFGAFFGNTVMTRMSYLIDRLMFLVDEWLKPFIHHFF